MKAANHLIMALLLFLIPGCNAVLNNEYVNSQVKPEISKDDAIRRGDLIIRQSTAYTNFKLDLAVATTPHDVNSGRIPGDPAVQSVGFGSVSPDYPLWLIRYRSGSAEGDADFALITYFFDGKTGELVRSFGVGRGLPPS